MAKIAKNTDPVHGTRATLPTAGITTSMIGHCWSARHHRAVDFLHTAATPRIPGGPARRIGLLPPRLCAAVLSTAPSRHHGRKCLRHSSFEGDGHQTLSRRGRRTRAPQRAPPTRSHHRVRSCKHHARQAGLARDDLRGLLGTDQHARPRVTAKPLRRAIATLIGED